MNIFDQYLDKIKEITLSLSKSGNIVLPDTLDGITAEIPNDVVAVRSDLPEDVKAKIYTILSEYIQTDEGLAVMDEIYGWTDIVPAVNSEFDVVKQAAEEFGLYDQ